MTVAWAIIIVAILYLLDKHNLLRKTMLLAGIAACVLATGFAATYWYQRLHEQWKIRQFAKLNECFDPSNGEIHPLHPSTLDCATGELLHQQGTRLPPLLPTCEHAVQPSKVGSEEPLKAGDPIPDGAVTWDNGQPVCVVRSSSNNDEAKRPFGNASCLGHGYLSDDRTASEDKSSRNMSAPRTFKRCDLVKGDLTSHSLRWEVVRNGERLLVLGRSERLDGMDHGDAWYKVRTENGDEGYIDYGGIRCDGVPESCKCGGDLTTCGKDKILD